MRYLLMICADEKQMQATSTKLTVEPYTRRVRRRSWRRWGNVACSRAASGLQPTPTAATVQVRNGSVLTSDGPFAETKEQLGGYFIVDCKDRDEAIEIAAKIPGARLGTIEVRPIWEMG